MNEFIFLSLENIDDILAFAQVCKKGNEIYKKWKNEWYTIHTKIIIDVNGKREIKTIGNKKYVTEFYTNSTLKYRGEYKNEKREKWTEWYHDGNKSEEGKYENGLLRMWESWHKNGTTRYKGEFKNRKLLKGEMWNIDGQISQ